jgi:hypothetical protein
VTAQVDRPLSMRVGLKSMHYLWWHGMAWHCMRASEEERRGALDWIVCGAGRRGKLDFDFEWPGPARDP